jgi:hypothetical protein
MIPVRIKGSTRYLGAPAGWTPDTSGNCAHLAIRDSTAGDMPIMESSWEPTPDELAVLNRGGKVYLRIVGINHPPVMVYALGPGPDRVPE